VLDNFMMVQPWQALGSRWRQLRWVVLLSGVGWSILGKPQLMRPF
jgi:hypothetical protein